MKPLLYGAKSYLDVLGEAMKYIQDRRTGRISSFKTPWTGLNSAGINGLEWGSMLTVAARPGSGKTMVASQILREAFSRNPGEKFNILEFQFEMGAKQYGSRDFAAQIAADYNVILSSYRQLEDYRIKLLEQYIEETKKMANNGIHRLFLGKPMTSEAMYEAMHYYFNELGGAPMLVTIDHSWLIKKAPSDKEKIATLYNTVEMLMKVKNELPVIIIMLSQLNRTIDEAARKIPGSIANYPTSSDIFGGDALMQGSDMVVVLNRPAKAGIRSYGPQKFMADEKKIFMHLIKVRNAANDDDMLYFDAEFNRQRMIEIPPPVAAASGAMTDFVPRSQRGRSMPSADVGSEL